MKVIAEGPEARLLWLKRQLALSITHSRYFKVKTCSYDPPKRAIPVRVKRLMKEIDELEKELENNHEEERKRCKNSMLRR